MTGVSTTQEGNRVFLSHSWKDRELAEAIRSKLEGAGLQVWSDALHVTPGSNIRDAIDEAIRSADNIVILLSNDALSSSWTTIELATAITSAIEADRPRLIPVLAEKGIRVPPLIADTKYVDITSVDDRDAALDDLVRAIQAPSQPAHRSLDRHTRQVQAERNLMRWEMEDFRDARASRSRTTYLVVLAALISGVVGAVVVAVLIGADLSVVLPVATALVGGLVGAAVSSRRLQ